MTTWQTATETARRSLGKVGIWTDRLDFQPAQVARDAIAELDALGFGAVWLGESARRREPFTNAAMLLAASTRIVVATGVAIITARDPIAMASAQRTLAEGWPGRFLLGVGVSHRPIVEARGGTYTASVAALGDYLAQMDDHRGSDTPGPTVAPVRVVGALGPSMMALARDRAHGAHPYLVTTEHTRWARQVLGTDRLLCPEQAVVLEQDPARARATARAHLASRPGLSNYRRSFQRQGFEEEDLADGGSDRLVDALVAWGSVDTVAQRIRDHLAAGADHVGVQVLTDARSDLPHSAWRALAAALSLDDSTARHVDEVGVV